MKKRNHNETTITKLKTINGRIIADKEAILEEQQTFYAKLYSSSNTSNALALDRTFFNLESPKLTPEQSEQCEGPITEAELFAALNSTQKNKAPGPDGLPCEFYRIFWIDLKEYLVKAVDHAFNIGELSFTQKQGAICLLPQKKTETLCC